MKKLVAVSIILALFSSVAFTQEIGLSTWSQAVFVPLTIYDHDDTSGTDNAWSSIGPYWFSAYRAPIRVNTTLAGGTEFAGIQIDLSYDAETSSGDRFFTDCDNVKLWIKPISMLKLTYGKMKEDDLRGKVGDFSFFAPVGFTSPGGVRNQDTIFHRFEPNHGFHAALTPIEGLYIGAAVDVGSSGGVPSPAPNGDDVWADNLQVGIGYTIANIGLVRAQYVPRGGKTGAVQNSGRIEAAFAFTGMEGLTIDVGAKIPLYSDDTSGTGIKDNKRGGRKLFELAIGAGFASGDFGIDALIDARFFADETGTSDYDKTADFYVYLKPSYNLGSFKVGGEIGFDNKTSVNKEGDPKGAMDLGAWIAKPVAGGEFQIGVMLGLPFGDYLAPGYDRGTAGSGFKDGQVSFSIPVSATVSF